jgi:hypothetical protein
MSELTRAAAPGQRRSSPVRQYPRDSCANPVSRGGCWQTRKQASWPLWSRGNAQASVRTNFRMGQPVVLSIRRLIARAARTTVRWARASRWLLPRAVRHTGVPGRSRRHRPGLTSLPNLAAWACAVRFINSSNTRANTPDAPKDAVEARSPLGSRADAGRPYRRHSLATRCGAVRGGPGRWGRGRGESTA